MRRVVSLILVLSFALNNICYGAILTEVTKTKELTIPFSVISGAQNAYTDIDLSKYSNFKIISKSVDNGVISNTVLHSNVLRLYFINGEYSSKPTVINKLDTIDIENGIKESSGTVKVTAKGKVTSIQSTTGDFDGGSFSNNIINLNVSKNATGIDGLDKSTIVDDEIILSTENNDKERNGSTKIINLPYGIANNCIPKTKDQTGKCGQNVLANSDVTYNYTYGDNGTISASFKNGIPVTNETSDTKSYPYYWIDRKLDGTFKQYNPNSIYKTPRFNFAGEGTYLPTPSDPNCLTVEYANNSEWADYCGFNVDNQKYVYIFDNKKGNPFGSSYNILNTPTKTINGQFYNTKKLTVEIQQDSTIYKREGNLYSCGYLVNDTDKYGDRTDAFAYEEQDNFINSINNQKETYVSHMKFNFGPNKSTFGGYFTYPYTVTCQYQHYKPAKLYNGSVSYYYESLESSPGYYYNGGVKISYEEKETVLDFPPSIPSNINYNSKDNKLNWNPSVDDYTPQNKLKYEIEIRKNIDQEYLPDSVTQNGQVFSNYANFETTNKFRVRAIDEHNQASDWGYMLENYNTLKASIYPEVVAAGESVKITAQIKANNATSVVAQNSQTNIKATLDKTKSVLENAEEASIMLTAGFAMGPPSREYILSQFIKTAGINDNKNITFGTYNPSNESVAGANSLKIPIKNVINDIATPYKLNKKGSILIPNDNFLNSPQEPFYMNNSWWVLKQENSMSIMDGNNEIPLIRCIQDPEESFSYFGDGWKLTMIKKISINTFKKNSYGEFIFKDFINVTDIRNPVTLTWDTYSSSLDEKEKTTFKIYSGTKYLGNFETDWEDISVRNTLANYAFFKEFHENVFNYTWQWHSRHYASWVKVIWDAGRDFLVLPYLGYKVQENSGGLNQDNIDTYNNLPSTRNVYRILMTDYIMDENDITKYLELIKTINVQVKDINTTFLDEVIPTITLFEKQVQIPKTTKNGLYIFNITADFKDGTAKTEQIPVVVATPIDLNVEMPYKMQKEKQYKITAKTSKYVEEVSANILDKSIKMKQINIDSVNKTWEINIELDKDIAYGIYDKLEGEFRQAEFIATLPSGDSETVLKPFMVGIKPEIIGYDVVGRTGDVVQITAKTTGYCTNVSLVMPDKTLNLVAAKDTNSYDNTWATSYTISQSVGQYDIEYSAKNYFDSTSSAAKLIVRDLEIQTIELGRLFYSDNNKNSQYIADLSISESTQNVSEGFLCSGEVLAIKVSSYGSPNYLKLDFVNDSSIKTCDDLTKKFEYYNPELSKTSLYKNVQELEDKYKFPLISNTNYYDKDKKETIFTYYYVIPYKTSQTLHSWYTLREQSGDAFSIDKAKLLERIKEAYKLRITIGDDNGSISKDISLDIFERYDTVRNRDLTPYLKSVKHNETPKAVWERE